MDDSDVAEIEEVWGESWFLGRDDDTGGEMALLTDDLEEVFGEVLGFAVLSEKLHIC